MSGMWQVFQEHQLSPSPQSAPFWPTSTRLLCVWKGFLSNLQPQTARTDTLWRKALSVLPVPQELHPLIQSAAAPTHTLLAQGLQVPTLRKRVCHALLPAEALENSQFWGCSSMYEGSRKGG